MTDEAVMPQVVVKYSPSHDGNSSPSSPSNRWRWWGGKQIHRNDNDNNNIIIMAIMIITLIFKRSQCL